MWLRSTNSTAGGVSGGCLVLENHTLFTTLKSLRGNPRGCVYTEPLWGLPFNLYAPYISVFMLAIGLSDKQIGLIVSISWGFQIVLALLSGVITDKLGRRRTTLIFDILAWSIPALISGLAQNFWYFLVAGIINSVWRITHNSWTCLLVEDAEPAQLVDIFTWIYIANIFVGFIAPLTGVLIGLFSLVPTIRGLYFFAAFMFAFKAIVTYRMTEETAQGKVRLHETRHQSLLDVLGEYRGVLRDLLHTPQTLYTAGIMLVLSICSMISGSFWAIIVTEKLHIPAQSLSIFPFAKSAVMLLFFFLAMPRVGKMHFKLPLLVGFLGFVLSQVVLVTAPDKSYLFLVINALLEAVCFAAVSPLVDRMTVLTIDPHERARIQSIIYVGVILLTSPFGWVAGTLSALDKALPFILNIGLFAAGAGLAWLAGRSAERRAAAALP
jgi:DHA1 family tetracycline resistance protein-like MFS transporter